MLFLTTSIFIISLASFGLKITNLIINNIRIMDYPPPEELHRLLEEYE